LVGSKRCGAGSMLAMPLTPPFSADHRLRRAEARRDRLQRSRADAMLPTINCAGPGPDPCAVMGQRGLICHQSGWRGSAILNACPSEQCPSQSPIAVTLCGQYASRVSVAADSAAPHAQISVQSGWPAIADGRSGRVDYCDGDWQPDRQGDLIGRLLVATATGRNRSSRQTCTPVSSLTPI